MGDPAVERESTENSPMEEVDRSALSDTGQPVFDQLPDTTSVQQSDDTPRVSRDESSDKLTPRHKRYPVADNQNSGGVQGGNAGVSVTLLTLDADLEPPRPYSRQHFLPSPRTADRDSEMSDLKLIRDFQVRRKYGRLPPFQVRPAKPTHNVVDLGLSGTRYFTHGDSGAVLDSARGSGKASHVTEDSGGLPTSIPASSTVLGKFRTEEDLSSVDSTAKELQSPAPSFPPLSPGPRTGLRSENSFYSSSRNSAGQSPSLLSNHFGFSTIRPDTFSGIQRRRMRLTDSSENDELLKELEHHAQKQILACQNMGFTHRGSRAAENVLSLKHTVSPSAFHPSSFFTRHKPAREDRSRSGTPAGLTGEAGEERPVGRRKVTPAGKLGMPRLLVPDRQEKAARRTTLPSVSGSSLQVVLAQSHGK